MTIIGEALENPRVLRLMTIPGIRAGRRIDRLGRLDRRYLAVETPEKLVATSD